MALAAQHHQQPDLLKMRVARFLTLALASLLVQCAAKPPAAPPSTPMINQTARAAIQDLSEQHRLSLPFPAKVEGRYWIGFLVYQAIPRHAKPSVIYPPVHLVCLDPASLALHKRISILPSGVVASHSPRESIGEYGIPAGMGYQDYLDAANRLSKLVPSLCNRMNRPDEKPDLSPEGAQYQRLFQLLAEAPLKPYYQHFGRDFFKAL